MPTPEFIVELRRAIGHDLLLLPGVAAIIRNEEGGVLMVQRSDTGTWHLPSGIVEPGEHPAEAVIKEVAEETGLDVTVDSVAAVVGRRRVVYPNGDQCEFVSTVFRCTVVGGAMQPDGDETVDLRFVDPASPELEAYGAARHLPLEAITGEGVFIAQPS